MARVEIMPVDDFMCECGYGTSKTDANNGYGCNHPDNEEYEMLWKDEDGYTHRGYEDDDTKPKTKQGKCYAFSCPLAGQCSLDDLKQYDKEQYDEVMEICKGQSRQQKEWYVEALDLVVVTKEDKEA